MFFIPSWFHNIIEHFVFQLPPPSYTLYYDKQLQKLSFYIKDVHPMENYELSNQVKVTCSRTKSSSLVVCMYYAVQPPARMTILYSHGNSCDLGTVVRLCVWLANSVHCNVLAYDYSGYGKSSGKPTEKQIYMDAEAVYSLLRHKYKCAQDEIVVMGQSLGSAPTLYLASNRRVAGVVIQSGFTSALNIPFPRREHSPLCFDAFENITKVKKVTSPMLVIHGTEDKLIGLSQGEALYKNCPTSVEPLWLQGAGHNDVEAYSEFLTRLQYFLAVELPYRGKLNHATARIFFNLNLQNKYV